MMDDMGATLSRMLTHVTSDQPHPVIDRLGIVPVYREDKIDGSDVASITYAEAVVLADLISRIADHVDQAATEGAISYRTAVGNIMAEYSSAFRSN